MLLLKLECGQFRKQREDMWSKENELKPRGKMEYNEVFEGVNYRVFYINFVEQDDVWDCSTQWRIVGQTWTNTVGTIAKVPL